MWDPLDDGKWFHQRPSFRQPVVPPTTQPCDQPLVCLSVNQDWVPYVLGALTQLAQPSTWLVASDADRADILGRVQDLLANLGDLMPCSSAPPVIAGIGTSQRACNIAGYLSNVLVKTSIQRAIDAINDNQTVLGYGRMIIGAIPGAGFVMNIIAAGLYGLYQSISGGTLTDYTDAINDETLWSQITCAIYNATEADGGVTNGNFPTIQSNVAAVSYTHADVITAISQYLSDLGAAGLQQLQSTGALATYDCSSCGTGISTGPSGLPVSQESGKVTLTILDGTGDATAAVTFSQPFSIAPIMTQNCDNEDLISSIDSITEAGFSVTITAAVDVVGDTSATVSWIAVLPGVV